MPEAASSVLNSWSNFYVIMGSGAAALTGLMFVVITLVADRKFNTTKEGVSTFSSPTVVHFCMALLSSALLTVPWRSLSHLAIILGLTALYGVGYTLNVVRVGRRLTGYEPAVDDWVRYVIVPVFAYVVLAGGAIALPRAPVDALFALGAAVVTLVFVGIHNAWDVVTYIAVEREATPEEKSAPATAPGTARDP
jgi:hypothetical protein